MERQKELYLTTGLIVRLVAGIVIGVSLPFLISTPSNVMAQIFFAFGNFLMVMGAQIR